MSAPLAHLNRKKIRADLVVFVSDNQSWVDAGAGNGTASMREWNKFRRNNPEARLVCIDIQPYMNTQVKDRADILNIGGFSDQVFTLIREFAAGRMMNEHWVDVIDKTEL